MTKLMLALRITASLAVGTAFAYCLNLMHPLVPSVFTAAFVMVFVLGLQLKSPCKCEHE